MALICATIKRDSVFLLRFPFLNHIQVFSWEISLVYLLKYPFSCFSSHFWFLVISVPLMFVLSVLFLVTVISLLPQRIFMLSSNRRINVSTLIWMLVTSLPPFYGTCSLSTLFLVCKSLCIVISFPVLWSIFFFLLSSSPVGFYPSRELFTSGQPRCVSFDEISALGFGFE